MKKFISQLKSGWHHGKGSKYTRNGNFELALKHYQSALKYSMLADEKGSVPVEMECIALTLVQLKDYEQAREYAEESYKLFKKLQEQYNSDFFSECVKRVEELIKTIERYLGNRGDVVK